MQGTNGIFSVTTTKATFAFVQVQEFNNQKIHEGYGKDEEQERSTNFLQWRHLCLFRNVGCEDCEDG